MLLLNKTDFDLGQKMYFRKSKYIFMIMTAVYIVIAVLYPFDYFYVGGNLLFALSVSVLLMSIGDVIGKFCEYLFFKNQYNAYLRVTIDFLNVKIATGQKASGIITENVLANFSEMIKDKYVLCKPNDFFHRKSFRSLNGVSLVFFVCGLVTFIVLPLVGTDLSSDEIVSVVTIIAFSMMMFNLFIGELASEKQNECNRFINEQKFIVLLGYSDFDDYFFKKINYCGRLVEEN